ncbi:APC family permease [Archaeoglobus neptunius]|uniref:APC family permease n=1 Tax=Archaeoglobus neptunius TaxID=2798580 RepID=UPI001928C4F4|nr:amino acid permease [Archaeoglobus neptunius]
MTEKRVLGFWDAIAIGVGSTIGPGIFTVIAPLVKTSGKFASISFLITGLILLFTVVAHARLAQSFPETGGFYVFVERAFGSGVAFIVGWSFCLSAASAAAFVSLGFADYLSVLVPLSRMPTSLALIFLFTVLNVVGIESVAKAQKLLTSFVVLTFLSVILAGIFKSTFSIPLPTVDEFSPILAGSFLIYTLFAGFEVVGSVAGEVKNPEKMLPAAMVFTVLIATAIYFLLTTIAIASADIATTSAPIERVARMLFPPLAPLVILAVVLGSMSVVNGQILLISRVASAMLDCEVKITAVIAGVIVSFLILIIPSVSSLAQVSSLFFILMIVAANMSYIKLFRDPALLPFLLLPIMFAAWADPSTLLLSIAWLVSGAVIYILRRVKVLIVH